MPTLSTPSQASETPTAPTPALNVVSPHENKKTGTPEPRLRISMSFKQRLSFYEQMATLVESGVTLIDSLLLMQAQEKSKKIRSFFQIMIRHISSGMSLSQSMSHFSKAFPSMQVALVEAAEKSGNLKLVLGQIVETMESNNDFLRKIKGAMFYPVILLVLALLLVIGMLTLVIPKIAEMYSQAGVNLPGLTQMVIDISHFVVTKWIFLLPSFILGVCGLVLFFSKLKTGRWLWEKILFSLPLIRTMQREKHLMMIAGNMSMLLQSGVLISQAFEITYKTINNLHYQKALAEIQKGVVMGKEVSQMMGLEDIKTQKFKEHPLFPLQMAQMIHIGETTGTIHRMLSKIQSNYHKSIDYRLKNISTIIEPLMIFVVAGLVGSILLAVMLPFFFIGSTIG